MKIELVFQAILVNALFYLGQCRNSDEGGSGSQNNAQKSTTNLVNITSAQLKYLNGNYIDKKTYEVGLERVNSTFTRLPLSLEILQDFPLDTTLTTILTQKDNDGSHLIERTFVTHICNPKDKYQEYLPPFLKELTAAGKCVQKGHYSFNDSGQFEFYKMFPSEEIKNHYFVAHNTIQSSEAKIISIDIDSKSVYQICKKFIVLG